MSKRPISPKKIAANKANGAKSNGPKTKEDKARISQNAFKHGLRSECSPLDISTQIPGEQTQLTELLESLTVSLHPADPLETQLVDRLAQLTLRLNRAARMESATLDKARADALRWAAKFPDDFPSPSARDFETHIQADTLGRATNELTLLSQYESRLSRDFARTLTQLRQSQKLSKQTQPGTHTTDDVVAKDNDAVPFEELQPSGSDESAQPLKASAIAPPKVTDSSCKPQQPDHLPPNPNFGQTNPNPGEMPSLAD